MTFIITKCGNVEWPKLFNNITDNNIDNVYFSMLFVHKKYLSKQLDTQI